MTEELLRKWNSLKFHQKTMMVVIKKLSYDYGRGIDYNDFSNKVTSNLKCHKSSMGGFVKGLNGTGLTESEKVSIPASEVRAIWLTENGRFFIIQMQKVIDDWANENHITFDAEARL